MSIQPFTSDADLLKFASRFFKDRVGSFRKDLKVCLTTKENGAHAYFPALITCIGFVDLLSGLHAGTLEKHTLAHLKNYVSTFFRHKSDYAHLDVLYVMFRHKIAHIAYPYLVFDSAKDNRVQSLSQPHRITWTVGVLLGKKPIQLKNYSPRKKLQKSVTPWDVHYDARMIVSLTALRRDIIASIYGPTGYLTHLRSNQDAQNNFVKCMRQYAPS
jgi:hypothetical protein